MLVYVLGTSGNPSYPADYWPGGDTTAAGTTSFSLDAANLQEAETTHSYRMRLQVLRITTSAVVVLAQTSPITVVIAAPQVP
jgi:hypothetical protein